MPIHRSMFRVSVLLGMIAGLIGVPAAPGYAGSSQASFSLTAAPTAVTLSDTSAHFGLIEAVFKTFSSSTTHTLLTIRTSQAVSTPSLSKGCVARSAGGSTTITCALGKVNPNTVIRSLIQFRTPSACATPSCGLDFRATLAFAEGNTIVVESSVLLVPSSAKASIDGNCVTAPTTLGTQATEATGQATQASIGLAADETLPCTPGVAGVDARVAPTPLHTKISFVDAKPLKQNAPVSVTFFSLPVDVTVETFVLYKLVDYAFGKPLSTAFVQVPPCSDATIPADSDSCVLSQAPYGRGGVIVNLLVAPSGDPGFAG